MASAQTLANVALEAGWKNRVGYYLMKAAIAVAAEDAGTVNHTARLAYANKVIGGTAPVERYALAVLTNATIAAAADPLATADGDLEYTVNSMFSAFSLAA